MWLHCGLDLVAIKEEVQKSDSYILKETYLGSVKISPGTELFAKGSIQEAFNLLSPEVNHSFLDCLSRQNFPLHKLGEDGPRIWFAKYLESLVGQLPSARRNLEDVYPSLAPPPSPDNESDDGSATIKKTKDKPPKSSPKEETSRAPKREPQPTSSSKVVQVKTQVKDLPELHGVPVLPPLSELPPLSKLPGLSPPPPINQGNDEQAIIIAMALTAAVTALFMAFIFICYFRWQRKNRYSGYKIRDDKPLLGLSLSDFSGINMLLV